MMRIKLACTLVGLCICSNLFAHESEVADRSGDRRYIGYRESPPQRGQLDPLEADMGAISIDALTVGRALKDVLNGTGYVLAEDFSSSDPRMSALLQARLPQPQRKLSNMSVKDALKILAGQTWLLVIDPVHRLISFELPPGYQPLPPVPHKPPRGLVLLGFAKDVETITPEIPEHVFEHCATITRDMTIDWDKRTYWCYPDIQNDQGAICND